MNDFQDTVDKLWREIEQERDEAKLKIHLAKAELHDEWEELEKKWHHTQGKAKAIAKTARETGEELEEPWHMLLDELKKGYRRIKDQLH